MFDALVYSQSSGLLYIESRDGARVALARGYSGRGHDLNDPDAEGKPGSGPIPRGVWRIKSPLHHPRLGPLSFALEAFGHDAHGRTEFFIHGDNGRGDKSASSGCIILGRGARECIRALINLKGCWNMGMPLEVIM